MGTGNLMIVQGGGSTAVFNASLSSAIAEAVCQKKIGRVYGARFGVKGLIRDEIVELGQMTTAQLHLLRNSPGALLGSSRFKPDMNELDRMVTNLRRLDVRYMIFIGGNGTMRGAELASRHFGQAGFGVQIVGVPKTVDNDIAATDRCPGYASAARYVAQSTRDLGMDIRSLPQPVTILEVIGRSIGWLAAASTLAKDSDVDAPHLVHLPEMPFHPEEFLTRLEAIVTKQGWAVAVVSEGIRNPVGSLVYELNDPIHLDPLNRPMTGGVGQFLADMVGASLKIRCRSEKPGLLARVSMAHISPRDQEDAELVGREGVRALMSGETDKMVALRPLKDPGPTGCELVPLSAIAGVERTVTQEWLTNGPLAVGPEFQNYLRPLVGELYRYSPAPPPAIPRIGAF